MADSRVFSNAADDTAAAFAHYALRSAGATTHALHLYEQVIECVGRRQISPDALSESLARFAQTHSATVGTNVSTAAERFASELASTLVPVADIEKHFAQLASFAEEGVPRDHRRTAAKQMNRSVANQLTRAAAAWFEFLGALDEERGRLAERYLLSVVRTVNPIGFDTDVVELTGPLSTTISTVVTLENTRSERASIHCAVSDVRRADGVGPAFVPDLVLAPDAVILERDHEVGVRLSLWLDDTIYDARSQYVGTLQISRDDASRLDVPLRITPTVNLDERQQRH